jgi:flagellar motor switch protein FliN
MPPETPPRQEALTVLDGDAACSALALAELTDTGRPATDSESDIGRILDVPVQMTVQMGRLRVPVKHVMQFGIGSVIELETVAGEPMDVLVNGYLIAQGEVVVVNDKFGIRLTDVVSKSQRLRRLTSG